MSEKIFSKRSNAKTLFSKEKTFQLSEMRQKKPHFSPLFNLIHKDLQKSRRSAFSSEKSYKNTPNSRQRDIFIKKAENNAL